jgi:hypothetical protein
MRKYQVVSHRSQGQQCSLQPRFHGALGGHNATVCSSVVSGRKVDTMAAHRHVKPRKTNQIVTRPHTHEGIAKTRRLVFIEKAFKLNSQSSLQTGAIILWNSDSMLIH